MISITGKREPTANEKRRAKEDNMTIEDFGTVTFEGNAYTLTQAAQSENYGTEGDVRYYAHAIDSGSNGYVVTWGTTTEYNLMCEAYKVDPDDNRIASYVEDEGNACDWDNPISIRRI